MKARAIGYEKSVSTDEWRSPTVAMFFARFRVYDAGANRNQTPSPGSVTAAYMGLFWFRTKRSSGV